MNSRSYHFSPVKQNHRRFKLKYAKKSIRRITSSKSEIHAFTLCGKSLWLETQLVKYSQKIWSGNSIRVNSFNSNPSEITSVICDHAKLPENIKENINLSYSKLCYYNIPAEKESRSDFTDLDTCEWFSSKNARNTIEFCNRSRMLALTVIIKGGRVTNKGVRGIICPSGMNFSDIQNINKIIEYIENHSRMKAVDWIKYKNKSAVSTMATIIFQLPKKILATHKQWVIDLINQGFTSKEIAEITKMPIMGIAGIRASLTLNKKYSSSL